MAVPIPVSVVVATRDRPQTLRVALEAIGRQSHPSVEVVLVDDSVSADSARDNEALLRALGRPVQYLPLARGGEAGAGPSGARNHGIAAASAELVAFCDDDDYWVDADHLSAAAAIFGEQPGIDVVFGNQEDHRDGHCVLAVRLPALVAALGLPATPDGRAVPAGTDACLIEYFPHLNTTVFRRRLLERIGGFWTDIRYAEDCDLFVRAIDASRGQVYRHRTVAVHNIPDRSRSQSASSRLDEVAKMLTCASICEHLLATCAAPAARRYARRLGGDAYRTLAFMAERQGERRQAYDYAKRGLAARFTAKWAAYTAMAALRLLTTAG